ncbi:amidase, partial [Pseudofrankia sp. BMG5.36]|uniref:amidase n=1 Tax=Pseudofrankia sp. BMG5.36 TaxID=1834512 RepID=UPI0008D93AC6
TPGGSSSGTGNGVAAGMFLGGLGTDTGGSIRWPAALCGISGMKQTFGRVPKSGCTPLGNSLDHIGPMARSAYDCALLLQVLAGFDSSDPCTVDVPVPDYAAGITGSLAGVRIGLDLLENTAPYRDPVLSDRMRAAADVLVAAGAQIVPITVPLYQELTDACQRTMMAEALAYQRGDLAERWADYGRTTRLTLAQGAFISGADYVQMQRLRRVGQRRMAELFTEVDLVLTPSTSSGALKLDDLDFDKIIGHVMTPVWNATGHPAMCIPIGFGSEETPLSMQLTGRPFEETAVFNAGHAYQLATDWHLRVAPLVADEPAFA